MAKSCQVIRDYNNSIQRVTDERGNDSRLYQEALNLTQDPEEALKIWSVAQTKEFKNSSNYGLSERASDSQSPRDRRRWDSRRGNQTLEGAPSIKGATGADPELTALAEEYAKSVGIPYRRQSKYVEVDAERAKRIAQAYDEMPHDPRNPVVREAYENLIKQTIAQYRVLENAGYKFFFFDETNDPYNGNPWNAMRDLRNNKVMGSFATEAGFGTGNEGLDVSDNPLLQDTGIQWGWGSVDGSPKRVLANDLFRAVHDAFGHGIEGAGFRARGEENAWQAHARLFTGSALAAITSETRGQNSWLNFGKYGEHNQTAKVEDTVFAPQKTGLMPEWTWLEGFDTGTNPTEITLYHGGTVTDINSTDSDVPLYMAKTQSEALKYADERDGGGILTAQIDSNKIADETDAREVLETMGYPKDEWMLHELIDPQFSESYIGDANARKLFNELKKRGFEAVEFSDIEVNNGNRTTRNVAVFNPKTSFGNSNTEHYYVATQSQADTLFQEGYRPVVDNRMLENITQDGLDELFDTRERVVMKKLPETEPNLPEVLDFMRNYNNQDLRLSPEQHLGLVNNSMSLPVSSLEDINSGLNKLYKNGVFTITAGTLRSTGLYTEDEVQHILGSPETQQQIKQTVDAIQGQVSFDTQDTEIELATYGSPELIEVFDAETTTGIGKFTQINPFEIDAQLRSAVGGVKDRNEFERNLGSQNEVIQAQYHSNDEYANRLFDAYSSMDRMPVLEDTPDGIGYRSEIETFTEEALIIGEDNTELINTLDFLRGIPKAVWDVSGIEVEDMLMRVEDAAAERGIDLVGISEMEFSFEDGIALLDSVRELALAAQNREVTESNLQSFYDNYNTVFNKATQQPMTAQMVVPQNRGRKLVKLDTAKSEQELFDQHSLLRTQDTGVYQRVNKIEDIERLYDQVTDMVMFNPNIIDKRALYPSAYTNNRFSLQKATNESNRDAIREDIQRWVKQQPFSEALVLYKVAFGHPITQPISKKSIQREYHRTKDIKDSEYLQSDYIADFARVQLEEKSKDSDLYHNVLKHFGFNQKGIVLKNDNPYTRQQINITLPTEGVVARLRDYAAISKDTSLNTLFPVEQPVEEVPIQFQREFYANNPEQLEEKTLLYKQTGPHIGVENAQDNWIKVNGQVAEKIHTYKNVSIYQTLPPVNNPNFYEKIEFKIQEPDNNDFKDLIKQTDDMTRNRKYFKDEQIKDKECSI